MTDLTLMPREREQNDDAGLYEALLSYGKQRTIFFIRNQYQPAMRKAIELARKNPDAIEAMGLSVAQLEDCLPDVDLEDVGTTAAERALLAKWPDAVRADILEGRWAPTASRSSTKLKVWKRCASSTKWII